MKSVKGRILKKINSIPQVHYLKQSPILNSKDPPSSPFHFHKPIKSSNEENKENINPNHPGIFRKPDPNTPTLFDPNLLEAFNKAVIDYIASVKDPLAEFEEKIPPFGSESIVLYTTSIGGVRKTYDDCNKMKMLLENLKVVFLERDLAMNVEFREELWKVLGFKAMPPRLFVKGRYIGGFEEVFGLHENGKLMPLVRGFLRSGKGGRNLCRGCANIRFRVCFECNGSRRVYEEEKRDSVVCGRCNENGLIVCSLCCC